MADATKVQRGRDPQHIELDNRRLIDRVAELENQNEGLRVDGERWRALARYLTTARAGCGGAHVEAWLPVGTWARTATAAVDELREHLAAPSPAFELTDAGRDALVNPWAPAPNDGPDRS